MKRGLLTGLLTIGLLGGVYAQNRAINFKHEGKFSETLAEAAKSNKLIFLDAYTSWCVPCKVLAKDVFTVDSIADFFNTNFINVGYDMEKGEGIELKKRYESDITAFPTLLFINSKGEIVHKIVGAPSAKEFLALARPALNPNESLQGLAKKFETGDRSLSTVTAYFKVLGNANNAEKAKEVATSYFDGLPVAELKKPAVWDLMKKYLYNIDSKSFKYVLQNRKDFVKALGEEKTDAFIVGTLGREVSAASMAYYMKKPVDAQQQEWLLKTLATFKGDEAAVLLIRMQLIDSRNKSDWASFNQSMLKLIGKDSPIKNPESKTSFMLNYTRKFADAAPEVHLKDALTWADILLAADLNPLYKLDLLNFKKNIYIKIGSAEMAKGVDSEISFQQRLKADAIANGTSLNSAIRGFM